MSVNKEHSDKREGNTEREASLVETNRYGFILRNGETDSDCSDGPCPELVRHREAKWLGIIKHWEHVMEKKSSKVKGHCQKGIPASVRVKCWPLLCGALDKMKKNKNLYKNLVKAPDKQEWTDVIERDTGRQFPFHEMFQSKEGHGQKELLQVLKAYTQYRPEEGYCQGQGPVAAVLLINMPAEEAFWCLAQISELYLPGYYSPLLEGVLFDAGVLCSVLKKLCPTAHKHLEKHGVEPLMFATDWLMCLYSRHLPFNTLLRVWDLFFCYGVRILFQVAVVLVRRCLGKRHQRKQCDEQMETLERLRGVKERIQNEQADIFIHEVCSVSLSLTDLQKLTEKEMDKWKKERPDSTFDPRERCHGYKMVWERAQVKPGKDRHNRSQTLPLMRSHSSVSPSFLRKKWKKRSSKTDTEWNGGGRDSSLCILEETNAGDMRRRSVCGTIGELKVMQERLADEFHCKKGPISPDSISALASSCNKSVVFENQQTVCVSHQHPKRSVEQRDQETHLIPNRNAEPHWDVKEKSIRCVADNEHTHHHESETEEKTIRDQNTEKQIDDVEQVMENKECLDENPKKQEPSSDDEKNMENQECQEKQILDIQNTEEVHLVLTKEERNNNLDEGEVQNEQKTDQEQPIEHQDEQNTAVKRVLQNDQTEQNDLIKRHVRSSYHAVENSDKEENRDHQDEEMPSNVQQICHLEQEETIRQFDHVETTHTNPDPAEDDQARTQQKHSSEQEEEKHPDTIQHHNDSSLLNLTVPHEEQAENQKHVQEEDTHRDDVQQYNQLEHLERREDVESEIQDYSDAEKHDGCHPKPGFPMEPEKNVCVYNLEKEWREDQQAKENNSNNKQTQNSESDLAAETIKNGHTVAHQAQFSKSELNDMDVKSTERCDVKDVMVSESETIADDGVNTPEPEGNLRLIISEENAIVEMTIVCQMAVTEESSQHHHNEEDYTCRSGHQDQNDVQFAPEKRNSFAKPEIHECSEVHLETGSDNTEQTVEEFVVNIDVDIDGPVKSCNDLNPSSMSEDPELNVELVTTPEFNVRPLAVKSVHNNLNPTNGPENQVSEERVNISEIDAIELAGPVKPLSDVVNPIGCGSPETDMEFVVTSGNSVDSEVTESNNQTNPELHKTHMSDSDDIGPQDCKTQATEEPVFSNISMSLNQNVPPAQLCRRRASSSRASYPTILSEDTFRVPRASWLVDSTRSVNQTDSLESTQEPCPLPDTHKKLNSSKPLRLFQRFRGEANKTPIPKILIQDFSEKEERFTAKERRKAEQQQKKEEKERKRQEKKAEKERKKPQTRGKSFQLLSRTSGGREGSSEQRDSQDLSPRRNSDYF